jgi:hypothetical protein
MQAAGIFMIFSIFRKMKKNDNFCRSSEKELSFSFLE